jgi:tetratricopeptide (TPR) repeat protein
MSIVTGLVPLALSRIGDLGGDEAKEEALRVLSRAVNDIPAPPEAISQAFERILSLSRALEERAARTRAFGDACEAITVSLLPLPHRRDLLDHALDLALGRADVPERIAMATTALDARIHVRWGERTEEVLADLQRAASAIPDEEGRAAAVLQIATSLARVGETDRALAAVAGLAASAHRAIGVARVAFALDREGLAAEAAALTERALAEIRAASPSAERTLALRSVLAHAVVTEAELGHHSALAAALEVADALGDADAQRDAVLAAITALPGATLEGEALAAALTCLDASIDRVDDLDHRVDLRGRLAVSLAALGELDAAVGALRAVADLVSRLRAAGVEGPGVALPQALPIVEILGELAAVDFEPDDLERFAASALDLLGVLDDPQGVAALLGEMTRFFASPALAYATRLSLLDRTLAVAQGIDADEARVEVVTHVANALSLGGASERGDGLFAGLVSGVGPRRAREARLSRAVVMVRLGRTADARAEIAAAAAATAPTFHAIEELAMTMARCGFLGDMLTELDRVDAARQGEARAQLADGLVEATYLDPHLREIGLSSLLEGTEGPVRETIACLLDQVRVLEGLGDVEATLARAFARSATLEDRRAAAIFDRQIIDALIERIRCAPQESPEPAATR